MRIASSLVHLPFHLGRELYGPSADSKNVRRTPWLYAYIIIVIIVIIIVIIIMILILILILIVILILILILIIIIILISIPILILVVTIIQLKIDTDSEKRHRRNVPRISFMGSATCRFHCKPKLCVTCCIYIYIYIYVFPPLNNNPPLKKYKRPFGKQHAYHQTKGRLDSPPRMEKETHIRVKTPPNNRPGLLANE